MKLTLEQIGIVVTILCAIAGGIWALISRAENKAAKREEERLTLANKLTAINAELGYLKERDQEHAKTISQLQQDIGQLVHELLMKTLK